MKEDFKLFDRVKFIIDFKVQGEIIKKGTIGTIRQIIDESILIQISRNELRLVLVPDTVIDFATLDDLNTIDPNTIIPNIFKVGITWYILNGYDEHGQEITEPGIIKEISLDTNENNDKFVIRFEDSEKIYKKKFLTNHGSL